MSSGRTPKSAWPDYDWQCARIVSELRKIPGEHLIIVRYSRCSARMGLQQRGYQLISPCLAIKAERVETHAVVGLFWVMLLNSLGFQ
jgi:hypothetical protein